MNTVEKRRSAVYRQLEAYEESWKQDHRAAMACRDLEDTSAVGIAVFQLLVRVEDSWRERVFRGTEDYSAEHDHWVQGLFRLWLQVTEDVLKAIPSLEQHFSSMERAKELRECAAKGRALLDQWRAPRLSQAVGLRDMTLSPEAAAEFKRIIYDEPAPPSLPPHPPLQEISTEEFLRLFPKRAT
jgi:hypothetical protein